MLLLRMIAILLLVQSAQAVPQLVDIRHAAHETYYRVVFDLTERTPVEVERHLDQDYIDVILHGQIQLLAKHLQQPRSPHLLQINLHDVAPTSLTYRLDLNEVLEVHAFRQGGGSGFRFIVDCLHRSGGVAPAPRRVKTNTPRSEEPVVLQDSSPPPPVPPTEPEDVPLLDQEELLQVLEIVATLEQAGDLQTACRILEEELVDHPAEDTLHFRLGTIYLSSGNHETAYVHLDPLLLKPPYSSVVARMLANLDTGTGAQQQSPEAVGNNKRSSGGASELGMKLILAGLTGLILVGGGLLVRKKMIERKHLASFDSDDDSETDADPEREATAKKAGKSKAAKKAGSRKESPASAEEDTDKSADNRGDDKPGYERDKEVYRLADKKKGTAEIAGTLGLSQDEVRLILQMRHQESSTSVETGDDGTLEDGS
jgi:hypothetical protein